MSKDDNCPLCKGHMIKGTTTFTVDYEKGVIVVRHVPALVCAQCGEAWIEDEQSAKLEALVQEAKNHARQLEVIDMVA